MTNINSKIQNLLKFKENITLVGFKDDGIKELIREIIEDADLKKETKFLKTNELLQLENKNYSILDAKIVIIENLENTADPLKFIKSLDINDFDGTFIFIVENTAIFRDLEEKLTLDSVFLNNVIFIPLIQKNEKNYLLNYCEKKYESKISETQVDSIFEKSGGHKGIFNALYKSILISEPQIAENYIKKIVREFDMEELKILRKIIKKNDLTLPEKLKIEVFRKIGIIKDNKFSIPVLKAAILEITPKDDIEFTKNGNIILKNIEEFSKTEIKVMKLLLENLNELVTKEELGYTVWAKDFKIKYSPWAIDQIIFRLRTKLDKQNISGQIKTIHAKGYVFHT